MDGDSCLTESVVPISGGGATASNADNGNGIKCTAPLNHNVYSGFPSNVVNYSLASLNFVDFCFFNQLTSVEWTSNNAQTLTATYSIDSGDLDFDFTLTKSDITCDTGVEIFLHDGASFVQHDLSIVKQIDAMTARPFDVVASGGATETMTIKINTADLSLDADGSVPMPVLQFKIRVASPDIASNPSETNNPVELFLDLSVRSPCRDATFDSQTLPDIIAIVDNGPEVDTSVTAFTHDKASYACGDQKLEVVEDGAFAYAYSEFLTVTPAQIAIGSSYTLTVNSNDLNHVNQHLIQAKVSLVDFPDTNLITPVFNITIRMNCLYIDILDPQWTSNSLPTENVQYIIDSGPQNLQL